MTDVIVIHLWRLPLAIEGLIGRESPYENDIFVQNVKERRVKEILSPFHYFISNDVVD